MERNGAALQPSELPHGDCLCPSRETPVLEGDKEREGKRTEGKGERSGREEKKAQNRYQVGTAKPRMYEKPLVNF